MNQDGEVSKMKCQVFSSDLSGWIYFIYQFWVEKQTQSLIVILFEQAYEYGLSILLLFQIIGGNGTQTFYSNI